MKILIVSPFFPPMASVAIVRISSIAREMIKKGYEITVIRNEYNDLVDKLSNSDKDLLNLETHTVEVSGLRYFEASKRYKEVFRSVMNKGEYDLVFITAGPYYTIPLSRVSKVEYNVKCIIDYRDLWLFDIRNKRDFFHPFNLAKKFLYFPIERVNLKHADLVVTVTEDWRIILEKIYRMEKFKVVANGYDDEQLTNVAEVEFPYHDRYVVAAFGKLSYYSIEYGIAFFKAMRDLSDKFPNLLVLHIGLPEKETEEAIKASGFDAENYINTGFVNYPEGIALLKKANANVIIDVRNGAMGTKIYDYVYVNKPLIYVGRKGTQLANFVNNFENGFTCYNENEIVKALNKILNNNISILTKAQSVQKYARCEQNERYLKLIEGLFSN